MISKLRLRHWKSHMESEFDFDSGVNAIIGIMGSGKTSILQAISFGLYGTFPAHQARRLSLEDLIMNKPQVMDEASVELEFSVGRDDYSVLRVLKRGKGTIKAELRKKGRLVEATPQGVTGEVSRILDMDYELFSKAVYSEQNGIDYFLKIPRGQRMDHIDRMLRLDRFEKAREGAVALSNRIRHEREEKLKLLAELRKERLPERINGLRGELEDISQEIGKFETELSMYRERTKELSEKVSTLEKEEEMLNDHERNLEGIISGLKQVTESIRERVGKDTAPRKSLEARLKSLESAIKELEHGIDSATKASESGREMIASLNAEIRIIKESLNDIESLEDQCPLCESEITKLKKRELVEIKKISEDRLRKKVISEADKVKESEKNL